jgi:hypothetical protein
MVRDNKTSLRHFVLVAEIQVVLEDDPTFWLQAIIEDFEGREKLVILTSTFLFHL